MSNKNLEVKFAVQAYKNLKNNNKVVFKQQRDEIIHTFVKSPIPNWGNIKFTVL